MSDPLTQRLAALDSCAVSDALDALALPGAVAGLSRVSAARRIAARVITVQLDPSEGRAGTRHLGTAAVEASGPGLAIVVANEGRLDAAGWGGLLSLGASLRGAEGVIVDGAARDIDEARALDFPVFARAGIARTARGRFVERTWNRPVTVGTVPVEPGDYVIADASGVVFVPSARAAETVAIAENLHAREAAMAGALRLGAAISTVMGGSYEAMLDRTGQ